MDRETARCLSAFRDPQLREPYKGTDDLCRSIVSINHIVFFNAFVCFLYFSLSENFAELVETEDYSDITLLVDGARFRSHKVILAARSEFFR